MDSQEYLALRLYAVRQGTSVEALVMDLGREDVAKATHVDPARTREHTATAILQRAGIDPDGAEHHAIAARAAAAVRRRGHDARPGQGDRQELRDPTV